MHMGKICFITYYWLPTFRCFRWNKLLNRIYELVRQIWEDERIPEEWKETITVPIYKNGDRDRCENYRRKALGNAAYNILANIILEKIKPYIEKITKDYQNGLRDRRSVTDSIFVLKIIMRKSGNIIRVYNIYLLIFKRHMTLYIETCYRNVWKNLKFLKN